MKILIGVNEYGGIEPACMLGLLKCTAYTMRLVPNLDLKFKLTQREWLPMARLHVFSKAKRDKVDYCFFVGEDIVLREDTLVTLLSYGRPIVSGLYFGRTPPYNPVVTQYLGEKKSKAYQMDELIDGRYVDAPGHDCLLVRHDVINALNGTQYDNMTNNMADDLSFGLWAKRHKYPITLSTEAKVGHVNQVRPVITINNHTRAKMSLLAKQTWRKPGTETRTEVY